MFKNFKSVAGRIIEASSSVPNKTFGLIEITRHSLYLYIRTIFVLRVFCQGCVFLTIYLHESPFQCFCIKFQSKKRCPIGNGKNMHQCPSFTNCMMKPDFFNHIPSSPPRNDIRDDGSFCVTAYKVNRHQLVYYLGHRCIFLSSRTCLPRVYRGFGISYKTTFIVHKQKVRSPGILAWDRQ